MIFLETERLQLRKIIADDYQEVFKLFSDKELLKYTDNRLHNTHEDTKKLLKKFEDDFTKDKAVRWVIYHKNDKKIIGLISIYQIDRYHKFATLGSFLCRKYQKKGLMPEARKATIKYAFDMLGLNRLEAQVFEKNIPSIKMLEKLGFQKEGLLRENFMINNKLENSYMFSLIKKDFKS